MTQPISQPPVYCSKCGHQLHESFEWDEMEFNVLTGGIIREGPMRTIRMCFTYYPPGHDMWQLVEGSDSWYNLAS